MNLYVKGSQRKCLAGMSDLEQGQDKDRWVDSDTGGWIPQLTGKGYDLFNDTHRYILCHGGRKAAKCAHPDTPIFTPSGLKRLGRFSINGPEDSVMGFDGFGPVPATVTEFHGDQGRDARLTRFRNGWEMITSGQHRFWACYGIGDFFEFDYISVDDARALIARGGEVYVPFITDRAVDTPNLRVQLRKGGVVEINEGVGYLLGAMCGDGTCTTRDEKGKSRGISFTNIDEECLSRFRTEVERFGGTVSPPVGKKRQTYPIHGKNLRALIELVGMNCLSKRKRVPDVIMEGPVRVLKTFLRGLFDTDGCAVRRGDVTLSSASHRLIEDVAACLGRLGIFCTIRHRFAKCGDKRFPSWRLMIYGRFAQDFHQKIGFGIKRKAVRRVSKQRKTICYGYPSFIKGYLRKARLRALTGLKPAQWERPKVRTYTCADGSKKLFAQIVVAGTLIYRSWSRPEETERVIDGVEAERIRIGGKSKTRLWHRANEWFKTLGQYVPSPAKLAKAVQVIGQDAVLAKFMVSDTWIAIASVAPCESDLVDISVPRTSSYLAAGLPSHNTIAVGMKICRHLWENDHAMVMVLGRTAKNIKSSGFWQDLYDFCVPRWVESGIGFEVTKPSTMSADTKLTHFRVRNMHGGESEVQLHSLEHDDHVEQKVKETRFSFIYVAQADLFTDRKVFAILSSQLRNIYLPFEAHQMVFDCNAPKEGSKHWLHAVFFRGDLSGWLEGIPEAANWFSRHQFLIDDNFFLNPLEVAEEKAKYRFDMRLYQRFVLDEWNLTPESTCFGDVFIPNLHVRGNTRDPDPDNWEVIVPPETVFELYLGLDTGDLNHAVAFACRRDAGSLSAWDFFDEIVLLHRRTSIAELTAMICERMDMWEAFMQREYGRTKIRWKCWSDRSAFRFRATSGTEEAQQIYMESEGRIQLYGDPKTRSSVAPRVQMLKRMLYEKRVFVSANCHNIIQMLTELQPAKSKYEVIDHHDERKHVFDAMTYLLANECPMDMERKVRPTTVARIVQIRI